MQKMILMVAAAAIAATGAQAAEVKIAPAAMIVQPIGTRGYVDLVVHNIGIRAGDGERLTVDRLEIALLSGGRVIETRVLSGDQLVRETGGLFEAPIPQFVEAQLLSEGGLSGFFGSAARPSRTPALEPGTALVASQQYFALRTVPDAVRVTVTGTAPDGRTATATASVPVQRHKSAIAYRAPVAGTWLMQAIPSLQSHHRLNAPSEFAVDFMKVDAEGKLHRGDLLRADSYYAFGAPVLAAADGTVVRVVDGATQDRASATRKPDESPQAAGQRIGAYNLARMKSDFTRAVAGNLVVIRHEAGGSVEYSSYGHLNAGIPVREGQAVRQGQTIGQVGDTGDSPTVHLHFQVNAGPDPFRSASLPVTFGDLRAVGGNTDVGRFVIVEPPAPSPSAPGR